MNQAFDDYVVARGQALLRLAWLLARDEQLAQDVVQEVLARASTRWSRIERAGSPDAYVRKMVVNELLSWRRRRHEIPSDQLADRPAGGTHAGDPAGAHADRDEVMRLLATLPHQQRAVLVLRHYEGLDDEGIAAVIGCAPVTVRAHAAKGIARLRASREHAKESL